MRSIVERYAGSSLRRVLRAALCLVGLLIGTSCALPQTVQHHTQSLVGTLAPGIERLQQWYDPQTGLYRSTGWWNSANALTTLIAYERLTGDTRFHSAIENTFNKAQQTSPAFLNEFYDDEGWWALAWLDAYELTRTTKYLEMARSIFTDMAHGWTETPCGGGLWWSKKRDYKNAIPNELFLALAARLANLEPLDKERERASGWARREWAWFAASGMVNARHLVNDGLEFTHDGHCRNNLQNTWSYNQGVILTGLVELAKATHDPALLHTADEIAQAAMAALTTSQGILVEKCEPSCGADGVQFKGIFVRNLALLAQVSARPIYADFLRRNSDSLISKAQSNDRSEFGQSWSGPLLPANASSQTAALDALIAAQSLSSQKPPEHQ